jgi:hypothetical protein
MNTFTETNNNNMRREPMSIYSITSNQTRHLPRFSSQPYHYSSDSNTQALKNQQHNIIRSPPTSPVHDQFIHSPPSSPHSFDFSPPSSSQHYYREEDDQSNVSNNNTNTLQERRQRNKVASAKYRQKKNIQQYEMRNMINQISERNAILERQLRELREENQKLRATTDKLRGKFVAKKLLRQWMGRQKQQRLPLPIPTFPDDQQGGLLPSPPNPLIADILDGNESDDSLGSLCSDI